MREEGYQTGGVEVVQIPEGAPTPTVEWCPVCGANFNPPHDCRQHLGALLQMRGEIDKQVERIEHNLTEADGGLD